MHSFNFFLSSKSLSSNLKKESIQYFNVNVCIKVLNQLKTLKLITQYNTKQKFKFY